MKGKCVVFFITVHFVLKIAKYKEIIYRYILKKMLENVTVLSLDYLYSNSCRLAESYKIGCHCAIAFYIIIMLFDYLLLFYMN